MKIIAYNDEEIKNFNYECDTIINKIKSNQDCKKIIDNILSGIPYTEFVFCKDINNLSLEIHQLPYSPYIPDFHPYSFYLPKLKENDYLSKYEELNTLIYIDSIEGYKIIDTKKTFNKLKLENLKTHSHDVNFNIEKERLKDFKNNYYLINDYIFDNYKAPTNGKYIFILSFDISKKIFFLTKSKNLSLLDRYKYVYLLDDINNKLTEIKNLDMLVFDKNLDTLDEIKSIEKINNFNVLENF